MRQITDQGLSLIKEFEGFSTTAYACPAGYMTIGYGHLIREGENFSSTEISRDDGEILLRDDVGQAERSVLRLINVPLSDGQFDALVSFTFNLGSGALQRSTLRRKLNRDDYGGAAEELPRWVYSGGKKLAGLIRRRNAERVFFIH